MKVAVIGATGNTGGEVVRELLSRGHSVVAIQRGTALFPDEVEIRTSDLSNTAQILECMAGADVIVSAYAPPQSDTDQIIEVTRREIAALDELGSGARLIMVGGAGGLYAAPGVTLIDSGHLPAEWLPIARSHVAAYELLKASSVNWTYFAPAAYFAAGPRTGKFRLGKDDLISDAEGNSRISTSDYAIALVDEIENPQHEKERFTIGY